MKAKAIVIIDGPEGVGKSTIAQRVATELEAELIHFPTDLGFLELPTIDEQIFALKEDFENNLEILVEIEGHDVIICDRAFLSTAVYQSESCDHPDYGILDWGKEAFLEYAEKVYYIIPVTDCVGVVMNNLRSRDVNDPDIEKFDHNSLIVKYEKAAKHLLQIGAYLFYVHAWGAADREDYEYLLKGVINHVRG